MKADRLKTILDKIGIPTAYQAFKSEQTLPYILFMQTGSDNISADNIVYFKENRYVIELYSEDKNFEFEETLEDLLTEYEIYWEKSEDIRLEDEKITQVNYYI